MEAKQEAEKRRKILNRFIINNLLIFYGLITITSGLVLQIEFHMGSHPDNNKAYIPPVSYEQIQGIDLNKTVWVFNYSCWSAIHKVAIVFFSLFMINHIYNHWKWYKEVISKRLIGKNKQVIIFSGFFMLVVITGPGSWLIDLICYNGVMRFIFIEIHDKLTLIFIIYLVLHILKKIKWFRKAYLKLNS
jgi:hypothetical protein